MITLLSLEKYVNQKTCLFKFFTYSLTSSFSTYIVNSKKKGQKRYIPLGRYYKKVAHALIQTGFTSFKLILESNVR